MFLDILDFTEWDEESLESLREGNNFLLKGHMAAVLKINDVEARS